ncbi:phage tail spike protein, partial [Escherichia sp. SS-MK2]
SQIIGWYVDMIQRRGRDTGKEIELGKDLIGVTRIEHSRDICLPFPLLFFACVSTTSLNHINIPSNDL